MAVHAAFGGSTNLLLHMPAIAFHAGLRRPTVDDWTDVNRRVPRLVDALPNGPVGHPTVRVFLAGGVPEVMLHLRELGLLELDALTVTRRNARQRSSTGGRSPNAARGFATCSQERDGIDPGRRHHESPDAARKRGLTSDGHLPARQPRPGGLGHQIAPPSTRSVVDADGVYRKIGPAKVFTTEKAAIAAIKDEGTSTWSAGDVLVLCLPRADGQRAWRRFTRSRARSKHLSWGKQVAVITDARFSGVSTGACIGHVSPGGAGRRPDRQAPRRRPHPDRHRPQQARRQHRPGRRRDRRCTTRRGARRNWRSVRRARTWHPTRRCPRIRACGRSCSTPAAASGAAASTMRRRLSAQLVRSSPSREC